MTEKKIEYFLKVCETKNITTAASQLFISRSVLSRHIQEIEADFDIVLFKRSKQGVALTEEGKIIYNLMKSIHANYEWAYGALEKLRGKAFIQKLRIGITPTNGLSTYRMYLSDFMRDHPDIPIIIEEYSAYELTSHLMNHTLDLCFSPVRPDKKHFKSLELQQNPIVLGMRRTDPLAQKKEISLLDLIDLPLGVFNMRVPLEDTIKAYMQEHQKEPNIVVRTSDRSLLHEMARNGQVYPLLAKDTVSLWKDIYSLPINFLNPSTNHLIWFAHAEPSLYAKTLIQYMNTARVKSACREIPIFSL